MAWCGPCGLCGERFRVALDLLIALGGEPDRCPACAPKLYVRPKG